MIQEKDIPQIKAKGISKEAVEEQLIRFQKGFPPTKVSAPAIVGAGILQLTNSQVDSFQEVYQNSEIATGKFIPASGAASRMFKQLYAFLESYDGTAEAYETFTQEKGFVFQFIEQLEDFAFYHELNEVFKKNYGMSLSEGVLKKKYKEIVGSVLLEEGLNYGELPKGLLSFHKYEEGPRTPAQEHLVEGEKYARKSGAVNLHFTVSPSHLARFKSHVDHAVAEMNLQNVNVVYSTQKSSTDTVAASENNEPFRDEAGNVLFRPAGHGALLSNLNEIQENLIFVKNIDNVAPDSLKADTILFKEVLAGVLISYQEKTFELIKKLTEGKEVIDDAISLLEEMGLKLKDRSTDAVLNKLNRPIRVCGMVKNEGQPGGGPFWVAAADGSESLQIVESAQIDMEDSSQKSTVENATHFNPVDIVCGVYDSEGKKFDLLKFRDPETGFITEKTYNGENLKAMELPGLWNGSMADWNTVFVEVPISTFSPVKTVNDLLKPEHQ